MHQNSMRSFEEHALAHFSADSDVLEIGPSAFPSAYEEVVRDRERKWDTLDIVPDERLTYASAAPYKFPIPDCTYDVVFSAQVLEHVPRAWTWMAELSRVCRPGGKVITICPVSWPFHPHPVDCWRIYPDGMAALMQEAGLEVITAATCSFEADKFRSVVPGRGVDHQSAARRLYNALFGSLGFPVEVAVDTVGIGRKLSR